MIYTREEAESLAEECKALQADNERLREALEKVADPLKFILDDSKKEGMQVGIPDLLIYLPEAKVLNLEFKRPDGKGIQSSYQVEVQQQLTNLGHNYYLIRSVYEVFTAIAEHTSETFRKSEYTSLSVPLTDAVLTEPFLHWPSGTTWHTISEQLECFYHI